MQNGLKEVKIQKTQGKLLEDLAKEITAEV